MSARAIDPVLAVEPADERDERPRRWRGGEGIRALVGQLRAVDLHQPHVGGACLESEAFEPVGIEPLR